MQVTIVLKSPARRIAASPRLRITVWLSLGAEEAEDGAERNQKHAADKEYPDHAAAQRFAHRLPCDCQRYHLLYSLFLADGLDEDFFQSALVRDNRKNISLRAAHEVQSGR